MTNTWIEHIRKFAKENNTSYACALSDPKCSLSYKNNNIKTKTMTTESNTAKDKTTKELEDTYNEIKNGAIGSYLIRGRLPASTKKSLETIQKQYATHTGKSLPSFQDIVKNTNKELEKQMKKDNQWYNSDEYKKSQEGATPYVIQMKKKKINTLL